MEARNYDIPFQPEYANAPSPRPAIDLADILGTLRREWRLPVVGLVIGMAVALIYASSVTSPYKSTTRILIDRSVNRYLQTNKIMDQPIYDEAEIGSQTFVLSSDSVVVPVVRSMDLAHDSEFVGSPKVGGLNSLRNLLGWNANSAIDRNAALERIAVETVHKNLTVTREDVANVMNVAFESEDSVKSAKIANAIAETYVAMSLEARLKSTSDINKWLQSRLAELKEQATEAERALENYKIANNLTSNGTSSQNSAQLSNLNTQLTNARIATAEAKQRYDRIKAMTGEGIAVAMATDGALHEARSSMINYVFTNSELARLRPQYRELMARKADIEGRVGPNHAVVIRLRQQIDAIGSAIHTEEQRIADVYTSEYQVATARENELAANVAQLVGKTETSSELRELESSAETLRGLYNSTLQKLKETNAQTDAASVQNARIITRATPPLTKNSKKAIAVVGGSVMLGLFLGLGAALGREWVADVFRTAKSVEQSTDKNCVILPRVAESASMEELVLDAPYSRFTEALRNVKAQIDSNRSVHGAKVIGIVSSLPKEGKTTIGANLAALTIAASGARTLVIDSDFHVRRMSAALAPDAREGLLEALENPTRLPWLISRRQRSGLHVLPCVVPARIPNSAELLGSPMMAQLLSVARKSYDYVIIEIAPVMSVVDVKMIERFVDQFVFVVEWGETKRDVVLEALTEAEVIRDRLACIILNKADPVAIQKIESYKGIKPGDYYQS